MIQSSYSHQRDQEDHAASRVRRRRLIIPAVGVFIFISAGLSMVWGFFGGTSELLETTKALEVTQQQAIDQLQVVQDQLVAQQTETKKLSERIGMLTEKLDALQQSVANIPAPSVAAPLPLPTAPPSKK
jgi:uncharacterized coiled-coil protein SlyX